MKNKVYITNDQKIIPTDRALYALIRRAIKAALEFEDFQRECEVSVTLVDNEQIHEMNLEARGVDRPTDVLSFPMFEIPEGCVPGVGCSDPDSGLVPLGDMCISMERAAAQAEEFGHSVERELAYLAVHSVLHLLGYDHMDEGEQKAAMRAKEKEIMKRLGYDY